PVPPATPADRGGVPLLPHSAADPVSGPPEGCAVATGAGAAWPLLRSRESRRAPTRPAPTPRRRHPAAEGSAVPAGRSQGGPASLPGPPGFAWPGLPPPRVVRSPAAPRRG